VVHGFMCPRSIRGEFMSKSPHLHLISP